MVDGTGPWLRIRPRRLWRIIGMCPLLLILNAPLTWWIWYSSVPSALAWLWILIRFGSSIPLTHQNLTNTDVTSRTIPITYPDSLDAYYTNLLAQIKEIRILQLPIRFIRFCIRTNSTLHLNLFTLFIAIQFYEQIVNEESMNSSSSLKSYSVRVMFFKGWFTAFHWYVLHREFITIITVCMYLHSTRRATRELRDT